MVFSDRAPNRVGLVVRDSGICVYELRCFTTIAGYTTPAADVVTLDQPGDTHGLYWFAYRSDRAAVRAIDKRINDCLLYETTRNATSLDTQPRASELTWVWTTPTWLWWTLLFGGSVAYIAAIAVHFAVGYLNFQHLLPAFGGLALLLVGLLLSYQFLCCNSQDPV